MKILAIDPALHSGYACKINDKLEYGWWDCQCEGRHQNISTSMLKISQGLSEIHLLIGDIDLIVFEQIISVKQAYVAHIYGALTGEILRFAEHHNIATDSVPPTQWKKAVGLVGRDVTRGADSYVPFITKKFDLPRNLIYKNSKIREGGSDICAAIGILTWAEGHYGTKTI